MLFNDENYGQIMCCMNYHLFQKDRLTQSPTLISIIVPLRGINTGEINTNGPETTTNEFDTTL